MKQDEIIELKIEKLTFGGEALSRHNDFVFFVKGACPNDIVKARITKLNKSYGRAEIVEIVEPSEYRVKPFCPIFNACGSCNWQFIDYKYQLKEKENILKETLKLEDNVKFLGVEKSPELKEYRCKVQYPIEETKNSKRILAGYYKEKSHQLTNIKFCPIQPKIVDEIVEFVRENWTLGAYCNYNKNGLLKNILLRCSANSKNISTVFVLHTDKLTKLQTNEIDIFVKKLTQKFKEIKSFNINYNNEETNTILGNATEKIFGEDFIEEKLKYKNSEKTYKIGSTSFFQTNPKMASVMFEHIKSLIDENSSILDAYGGVGSIGIWTSDKANKITLVEENSNAVKFAKENFKLNSVKNYEVFEGDAKVIFNNFLLKKKTFDYVILDPPRKGSDKKALEVISKLTNKIIYTSCNPQTLARDIKILEEKGFKLKSVRAFDMFPNTYHMETVALIERDINA